MTDRDDASPSSQPYELFMFARKHELPLHQAREIIDQYGPDRAGADAAAAACSGIAICLTSSPADRRQATQIAFTVEGAQPG